MEDKIKKIKALMTDSINEEVLYDASGERIFVGEYVRALCDEVIKILKEE